MRVLYYVPILHTIEELGTITQPFQRLERMKLGVEKAAMQRIKREKEFNLMAEKVIQMGLDCPNLCIYIDGFPVEKPEVEKFVYNDLVYKKRLPTFLLIDRLVRKGATLKGTESPELLREEYQYVQKVAEIFQTQELPEGGYSQIKRTSQTIQEKRDNFIAARIDKTLKDGETGILFIGAMHKVEKYLPNDIQIVKI